MLALILYNLPEKKIIRKSICKFRVCKGSVIMYAIESDLDQRLLSALVPNFHIIKDFNYARYNRIEL